MKMKRIGLLAAAILCLVVIGYLAADEFLIDGARPSRHAAIRIPNTDEMQSYLTLRAIVSTVNTGLSLYLLMVYVGIYSRTRAEFTIGLVILAAILLVHAIMSNPLLYVLLPFRPYSFGFFTALPELFTTVAVVVLLYLSQK
jgi:hypothetical protein